MHFKPPGYLAFQRAIARFFSVGEASHFESASLDELVFDNLELLLARVGRVMMTTYLLILPLVSYRRWAHEDYFTLVVSWITAVICTYLLITRIFQPETRIRLISITLFATGIAEMMGHGLIEDGRLLFFLACSIAAATMNVRFSTFMFSASFLTVALVGYLFSIEFLKPLMVVDHPALTPLDVASSALNFFLILGTVQYLMFTLFSFLNSAWEKRLLIEIDLRNQKETVELQVAERTKALQKTLNERNEILQIVAHELRNPIAGLKLTLETIQQFADRLTPEKQASKLALAIERLNIMNDTVEDLLYDNAPSAVKDWLAPIPVLPIVSKVIRLQQEQAQIKGISIFLEMEHDHLTCHANGKFLQQILRNLLSNAIKFSYHQGKILIRVHNDEKSLYISVVDEGQGLSDEDKRKLFKKFSRLSAKPTGNESSIGLGLNIAKELVEKMNGTLTVESPGKQLGSSFTVKLKLGQPAAHPLI